MPLNDYLKKDLKNMMTLFVTVRAIYLFRLYIHSYLLAKTSINQLSCTNCACYTYNRECDRLIDIFIFIVRHFARGNYVYTHMFTLFYLL